jgi:DNA processing protein
MDNRGLLDLIISLLPGLKVVERIKMIQNFNNEEELYLKTSRNIEELINRKLKNFWEISDIRDRADRIDTICKMRSIKWVSWDNADYPPLLREIYDPPPVLFYKGALPNPEKSLLGMVGTRKPSPQAASQAYRLAFGAGKAGISVISGLAIGIDAMSHRGNLVSCVPGYAVLGSGIDEVYPSANRPLAKRILDSGGALISEYPPGTRPARWTFPERNRIIAAFSRGVLIVEAPVKSGALITAASALEQGKDIWVASVGCQKSDSMFDREGTGKLVRDGAEIIQSPADIFEKWNMEIADNNGNIFNSGVESGEKDIVSFTANMLKIEY